MLEAILAGGVDPARLSSPGTRAAAVSPRPSSTRCSVRHRPIAGVILFSPELDLLLDEPSVSENADRDILPWNIPTSAYLHGRDPDSASVSAVDQNVSRLAADLRLLR